MPTALLIRTSSLLYGDKTYRGNQIASKLAYAVQAPIINIHGHALSVQQTKNGSNLIAPQYFELHQCDNPYECNYGHHRHDEKRS